MLRQLLCAANVQRRGHVRLLLALRVTTRDFMRLDGGGRGCGRRRLLPGVARGGGKKRPHGVSRVRVLERL
jgi:hypothetical protein